MLMTSEKGARLSPEGWVEASPSNSPGSYVIAAGKDGKSYVCDGWRNPIRCVRVGTNLKYLSSGPNGKDESGRGDDIVQFFPAR